jgi:hypothetical protein
VSHRGPYECHWPGFNVNYGKYAESQWGAVSQTLQTFTNMVQAGFNTRRSTLQSAAGVEACSEDVRKDATCTYRGNHNNPAYQPPCQ